jgi:hypothetical protein
MDLWFVFSTPPIPSTREAGPGGFLVSCSLREALGEGAELK